MEIRKLRTSDVFAFARVVKASGVRPELVDYARKLGATADVKKVGFDVLLLIAEALASKGAEAALYEALAPVCDLPSGELAELPPQEFFHIFEVIAAQEDDLVGFLKSVFNIVGRS